MIVRRIFQRRLYFIRIYSSRKSALSPNLDTVILPKTHLPARIIDMEERQRLNDDLASRCSGKLFKCQLEHDSSKPSFLIHHTPTSPVNLDVHIGQATGSGKTLSAQTVQYLAVPFAIGSWYTPVGWIQNFLNYLHISTGLPWWEVIVLATIIIRTCTLPIIVSSQRRSASMLENQPKLQKLVDKMEAAKRTGDRMQVHLAMMEMQEFMREKHMPMMLRTLSPMFANATIFTCYFLALRGMASMSLESMKNEGVLWFTDLTMPDPILALPTMCALTTLLVIELGIEFGVGAQQMQPGVRWFLRIAPFGILLVASKIPAAVMCYWFTSNVISLIISVIFRIAAVRRFLKIPAMPPRQKRSLRESWRLPQFFRDYLSGPFLLARAAREKFRKASQNANVGKPGSKKDERSQKKG